MKLTGLMFAIIFLIAVFQPSPASAGFLTGNDLYKSCSAEKDSSLYYQEQARCFAYVFGAYDALDLFGRVEGTTPIICSPGGLIANQVVDIVIVYLKNNPETRHYTASDIVMMAMSKAFPCKTQP